MAFIQQDEQYLQLGNYRLTSHEGKCVSCCRAVPIFASEKSSLKWQKYNSLEKICVDCAIHNMERLKVLPRYHLFENMAKENANIENEKINYNIYSLEKFNLHNSNDSTSSSHSTGICDFNVKENHEFDKVDDETDDSSRIIRVSNRYKFHDEYGPGINDCEENGIFKNIKKHVNYPNCPDDLNELFDVKCNGFENSGVSTNLENQAIPFTLPAGLFISKRAKIEEKLQSKPDPDFVFENYEHCCYNKVADDCCTSTEFSTNETSCQKNKEMDIIGL